jgi:hypothetical protein
LTVAADHAQREPKEFAAFGQFLVVIGLHVLPRLVFKREHLSALAWGSLHQHINL